MEQEEMGKEEIIQRLKEVKKMKLPKMTYLKLKEYGYLPKDFIETEENIKLMDEYLNKYLDSKNEFNNGCWLCGNKDVFLTWGLTHGVSYSNCCGLEYKTYHYPKDICKDNKLFKGRIIYSLQYHPEGFEIEENTEEDD